jgi:hypothetical protein
MKSFRTWKSAQRASWHALSLSQQSGWLTGLITLGATMTALSATLSAPSFWQGFLVGVWSVWTVLGMIALLAVQWVARKR